MKRHIHQLVNVNDVLQKIQETENVYVVVNPYRNTYLQDLKNKTLLVWTSRGAALEFMQNNLDKSLYVSRKKTVSEVLELTRLLNTPVIRFDFQIAKAHPEQEFINYKVPQEQAYVPKKFPMFFRFKFM